MPIPVALTIAGSDPSGGAGIQADLKTFHQFEVYGAAVVTLLTVQNTMRLDRVECVDPQLVREQIRAVIEDLSPAAVKTGALGTRAIVEAVAEEAAQFACPLVVDPVMISKHGLRLMAEDARESMARRLAPLAFLLTPNIPEAAALTGIPIRTIGDMRRAAECLAAMGARAVLIKGGHGEGAESVDLLVERTSLTRLAAQRIATQNTHGSGCTLSSAIAAGLAKGLDLVAAVREAKAFVSAAIAASARLDIGTGRGPVHHLHAWW